LGAKFSGDADFRGAKFSGDADFEGAEFSGDCSLLGGEPSSGSVRISTRVETAKDATVDFQWVRLLKPQQVFFHHVDLSRWSFLDTDLRRIDFDDVTWGTIPSPIAIAPMVGDGSVAISHGAFCCGYFAYAETYADADSYLHEIRVLRKSTKRRLAKVERLYRHLKQNYESQRDYGRAGDFYYGEMEMKRRQLNPLGQIPFWIYRILSGYGESYPRALFWLVVMWLLFAVLFTVVGYTDEWGNHADLWRSLIYSAQSMTLFHELNITFHSAWGKAIKLVASVLGVIQIALFGLALQRRFKR
jgi:hypothetical protein